MNRSTPISVEEFASRFGLGRRWASGMIRKMRHVQQGRRVWTTEEWLAEWLAANALPAENWPPKDVVYDPLEEVVATRVISLFGHLAAEGKIKVISL